MPQIPGLPRIEGPSAMTHAPHIGEHSAIILKEWGYSDDAIAEMLSKKVTAVPETGRRRVVERRAGSGDDMQKKSFRTRSRSGILPERYLRRRSVCQKTPHQPVEPFDMFERGEVLAGSSQCRGPEHFGHLLEVSPPDRPVWRSRWTAL